MSKMIKFFAATSFLFLLPSCSKDSVAESKASVSVAEKTVYGKTIEGNWKLAASSEFPDIDNYIYVSWGFLSIVQGMDGKIIGELEGSYDPDIENISLTDVRIYRASGSLKDVNNVILDSSAKGLSLSINGVKSVMIRQKYEANLKPA